MQISVDKDVVLPLLCRDIEIRIKQRLPAVLCACQRRIRSRLTTVLPGTVISVAKPPPPLVFRNFAPKTRLLGRLREEKKGRPDLFFSRNDLLCHELNLSTARVPLGIIFRIS